MMDELGLVHMNGRLYDPLLGRMLSADPVVQTPENLQNYNRYSYVLNNPVSYADPSGYVPVFSLFAMAFVVSEGMHIVTAAAIMFVAGFADALLMGANPRQAFKSGLIAAVATVITYQVGNHFNKMYGGEYASNGRINSKLATAIDQGKVDINWNIEVARHLTHGAAQGGLAESTGGDFGASFLATFTSSLVGSAMMMPDVAGSQLFGSFEGQLVAMTVVGGTVSEIGGGKFANGAYSAALVKVLNLAKKRMAQGENWEEIREDTRLYLGQVDESEEVLYSWDIEGEWRFTGDKIKSDAIGLVLTAWDEYERTITTIEVVNVEKVYDTKVLRLPRNGKGSWIRERISRNKTFIRRTKSIEIKKDNIQNWSPAQEKLMNPGPIRDPNYDNPIKYRNE
jgi:RHS repeat-associated protein